MACPERKNVKINTFITQSNSSSCWASIEHFQLRKNCSPIPENSVELICRSFLFLLLSPRWVLWSSNFEISNSPPFFQVLYTISSILCWNFLNALLEFSFCSTILQLPRPQELALYPANTSSSLAASSPCFMHVTFFSSLPEAFKMNDLLPKFLFLPSFCLSQECFPTLCAYVLPSWVRCFTQKSGSSQLTCRLLLPGSCLVSSQTQEWKE